MVVNPDGEGEAEGAARRLETCGTSLSTSAASACSKVPNPKTLAIQFELLGWNGPDLFDHISSIGSKKIQQHQSHDKHEVNKYKDL